ncbi:hypothetical protein MASR1M31_03410 [Porphyromonadaceae bacterium]
MTTTKIFIKPYLAEYIRGKFCNCEDRPVKFPDNLEIYHMIWDLTERRPVNCTPDEGNIEIILPERGCGKSPVTYNYLGHRSHKIIERKIETLFMAEMHDTVTEDKHRYGMKYIDSIYLFLQRYSITSANEESLWKNYYRWKNKLRSRNKRSYSKKYEENFAEQAY